MKSVSRFVAIALTSSFSVLANAGVIDFTSSQWSSTAGASYSAPGTGVTLSASGSVPLFGSTPAALTFNPGSCGNSTVGLACTGAGIGIDRTSIPLEPASEINTDELLTISFANLMTIDGIDFLKMEPKQNFGIFVLPADIMSIRANGTGPWQNFSPLMGQLGGFYSAAFSASNVSSLEIRGFNLASEASLARISYVPTPGTAALLLLGVAAVAYKRRKSA
jgi:hypothetical protein